MIDASAAPADAAPPLEQFPPLHPNKRHLWVAVVDALMDLPLDKIALEPCSADEVIHQLYATTDAQRTVEHPITNDVRIEGHFDHYEWRGGSGVPHLEAFGFDATVDGLSRHVEVSFDPKFDNCTLNKLLSRSMLRSISSFPRLKIRHSNPVDGFLPQ